MLFYRISSVCLALHAGAPRAARARRLGPSWARLGLPKTSQDSSKTSKIAFWRRLGRVLPRLGAVLERLGTVLGRLGLVLGRLWVVLGRLWVVLGRFGGVLEASWGVLEASWGVLGASWETKKPYFSLVFSMFLRS